MALAAAVVLVRGVASADPNTGTIYGKVMVLGTHQPICPITVTARSNRQPEMKTHTLADGTFHFFSVSPGPVNVIVGHDRFARTVIVSANLPNEEAHVIPIYLPRLRAGHGVRAQYCGTSAYSGYGSDYDRTP
ncbi:MAG TPA: hypothetical protein VJP85_09125 [Candidatus Baltobacteraceae bacterium]|nr:hypothetical protein [Candidatus Baltobacteraceae bacterium]